LAVCALVFPLAASGESPTSCRLKLLSIVSEENLKAACALAGEEHPPLKDGAEPCSQALSRLLTGDLANTLCRVVDGSRATPFETEPSPVGGGGALVEGDGGSATPASRQLLSSRLAVSLRWTPSVSPNVVGYNVYRAGVSHGPYAKLNSAPAVVGSYIDYTVQGGSTYYYVVTAVDGSQRESAYSNEASAIVSAGALLGK